MIEANSKVARYTKRIAGFILESLAYLAVAAFLMVLYLIQPVWEGEKTELPAHASLSELRRHVEMLSTVLPRRDADADLLEPSARYIFTEFAKYSDDVSYQDFDAGSGQFKNVIARFGPKESASPLYVIGAHYDSEHGNPGADDNASGIAGLLELARLFARVPPQASVELVAYALEEPPYFRTDAMGSFRHAKMLLDEGREVALMVSLETLGYYRDDAGSQAYPFPGMDLLYPDRGNFIALVGRLGEPLLMRRFKRAFLRSTGLPAYSINAPAQLPGVDFSDHLNFWYFDFPAIMVTDTAFYRNHNYHESSDTMDTLDFARMAQAVDGVFGAVGALAGALPVKRGSQ